MPRKSHSKKVSPIDKPWTAAHTKISVLQVTSNNVKVTDLPGHPETTSRGYRTLVDLDRDDSAILDCIDLPGDDARRLMELGFLPGTRITAGLSAPGGDPRVFRVDGSEIALRRETARQLKVRLSQK